MATLSPHERRVRALEALKDPHLTPAQAIALQIEHSDAIEAQHEEDSTNSTMLSHAQGVADEDLREQQREADTRYRKHEQKYGERRSNISQASQAQGAGPIAKIMALIGAPINELHHAYRVHKEEKSYKRRQEEHGRRYGTLSKAARERLRQFRKQNYDNKYTHG